MKKYIVILFLTSCFLNVITASAKDEVLLGSENKTEWEGMVKVNTQIKRSETGSFELYGKYPTELISVKMIPIDINKAYKLSAWMRSADNQFPASAFCGLRMYDKDKKEIFLNNVGCFDNTEASIAINAVKGTKELRVVKNPEWHKRTQAIIAFNIKDNYDDLPNFELSPEIEKIIDEGNTYKVILKGSMPSNYPEGTKIRLHSPYRAPFFWCTGARGWLTAEWKLFSNTMKGESECGAASDKFWKGVKYVRVFVWFGNYNFIPKKNARLLVDDIKFILVE